MRRAGPALSVPPARRREPRVTTAPTLAYEPPREAAMAAFAKSWRVSLDFEAVQNGRDIPNWGLQAATRLPDRERRVNLLLRAKHLLFSTKRRTPPIWGLAPQRASQTLAGSICDR